MSDPFASSGENEGSDDEPEVADSFEEQLRRAKSAGQLSQIPVVSFKKNIDEVDDVKLLEDVHDGVEDEKTLNLIEKRLDDVNGGLPDKEDLEESEEVTTEVTEVQGTDTEVEVSDIASGALTPEEAREKQHLWRVLIWGPPGVGKTHFTYSMPGPVCIIDTEGKAHDIAHKFDKEFYLWQPTNYDEAIDAVSEALDVLHAYRDETGTVGTLAVDSISIMWGWSQQKYVKEYYGPNKDTSDVEFSAGFGSGQSDWKKIKEYHNVRFRQPMLDSPFHLCWTAMSEEDYEAALEGQSRDKPAGEKENVYKVDHIIHLSEDDEGIRRAELEKSGLIKHRFAGLEDPTFDKMQEIVNDIDEAEISDEPVDVNEITEYDIEVFRGNPRFVSSNGD